MTLGPGTRLGVYEVTAQIGEGGMGQVYRATDTKLKRQVAMKILPPSLAADTDRLARFQREAEVLASLNHPQIAAIYGLEESGGVSALVMELVDGEDLSQRISRGAIPLNEALPIARQIAEALEAAHEQGIIHRDLKPANIKVRADGMVKVLDFGLAKAMEPAAGSSPNMSLSPTLSIHATQAGIILGTAAYMSPEQAAGKPVDKRSDLWSFGVVVLEMLTGRPVFEGETVSHVLASVLKSDPDWTALPATTPAALRRMLRRCLEKDRKRRLSDAADARLEIEEASAAPAAAVEEPRRPARRAAALVAALVGVGIAGVAAILGARFGGGGRQELRQEVARLALPLAPGSELADGPSVVISPDGTQVAYVATRGGISELYRRPLNGVEARVLTGTRGATAPFFSPDGQWLGFFADGKLKKVSTTGGVVVTLADASLGATGTWGPNDTIVFTRQRRLLAVPAAGGEAHPLPMSQREGSAGALRLPEFLPGGESLLVVSSNTGAATVGDVSVEVLTLKTGARKTLIQGSPYARYLPTGHLIFLREGVLRAVRLDLQRMELTGAPVDVMSGVRQQQFTGLVAFSCSRTGTCVYIAGGTAASRTVALVDRDGTARSLPMPPKSYSNPRFSPAGDRIALWVEQLICNIEVVDVARGTVTRFTSDGDNHYPVWTPDGQRITYLTRKATAGSYEIVSRLANGSGSEDALIPTRTFSPTTPLSWSRDGVLAFADRGDIWLLPRNGEPHAFEPSPSDETAPAFSPDGRWLAYVSDESGRYEVYVRSLSGPSEKYLVSTAGGLEPVWSRDSRELFFRSGDQMLAVQVGTESAFRAGRPRLLFTGPFLRAPRADRIDYDVSPDGNRFVMLNSGEEDRAATQISVVLNWFEELRTLVPTK